MAYGGETGYVMSFVVPSKRVLMMVSQRVVHWTNGFGHGAVVLIINQQRAIVELRVVSGDERRNALIEISKHVRSLRGMLDFELGSVVSMHSPVVGSTCNGAIENATKREQGQKAQDLRCIGSR